MSRGISKYIAAFQNFGKALIVLSPTSGVVSIASFTSIIGAPVGIASPSTSFSFAFSKTTEFYLKSMKYIKNSTQFATG